MTKTCQLSARRVSAANKTGFYGDGSGLYLQVSRYGTKSWVFRFKMNGKARDMGLGSINTFTLKEARERARKYRQLVADGIDPIEDRRTKERQRVQVTGDEERSLPDARRQVTRRSEG